MGKSETVPVGQSVFPGRPTFWRLWATLEEELSWDIHYITLQHVITKRSQNVLSKSVIFCWAAFIAILS